MKSAEAMAAVDLSCVAVTAQHPRSDMINRDYACLVRNGEFDSWLVGRRPLQVMVKVL